MMKYRGALLLAALAVPASAEPPTSRIELACLGGGAANKASMATADGWNSSGDYAQAQVLGTRSVGFEDQVNLWIDGSEGSIRMPRTMLPPIRGGENGWFKIKSVQVTDREITGSVAINPLNSPKLRIDRYTGNISISGKAGDFTGHCQRYDPATQQRAF